MVLNYIYIYICRFGVYIKNIIIIDVYLWQTTLLAMYDYVLCIGLVLYLCVCVSEKVLACRFFFFLFVMGRPQSISALCDEYETV